MSDPKFVTDNDGTCQVRKPIPPALAGPGVLKKLCKNCLPIVNAALRCSASATYRMGNTNTQEQALVCKRHRTALLKRKGWRELECMDGISAALRTLRAAGYKVVKDEDAAA